MIAGPEPVSPTEFADLIEPLGPFEPEPHVAVAVSGGRDSLTLAVLADEWARDRHGRMTALVVDHGLRPGSAAEAGKTVKTLESLRIGSVMLRASERPSGNMQNWARQTRYRLMEDWCRDHGVLHLLVGHHQEDQAETVLANQARAPGPRGNAGMPAVRELAHCRVLRPLLTTRRARLTATLMARDIGWIDDPSNTDRRFRRVRFRQSLNESGDAETFASAALAAGHKRRAFDREVADATVAATHFEGPAMIVSTDTLKQLQPEVCEAVLAGILQGLGGRTAPLRGPALKQVIQWALRPGPVTRKPVTRKPVTRKTAAGCRLESHPGGLRVARSTDPRINRRDMPFPIAPAGFAPSPAAGK